MICLVLLAETGEWERWRVHSGSDKRWTFAGVEVWTGAPCAADLRTTAFPRWQRTPGPVGLHSSFTFSVHHFTARSCLFYLETGAFITSVLLNWLLCKQFAYTCIKSIIKSTLANWDMLIGLRETNAACYAQLALFGCVLNWLKI